MGFWKYGYFNENHYIDFFESMKKVSSEVTKMASDLVDKSANEAIVLIIKYLNEQRIYGEIKSKGEEMMNEINAKENELKGFYFLFYTYLYRKSCYSSSMASS